MYAVETLDSEGKASKLNDNRKETDSLLNVFIQVNTSGEEQKSGLPTEGDEILKLAKYVIEKCPKLNLLGLMTIGSVTNSLASGEENPEFKVCFFYFLIH